MRQWGMPLRLEEAIRFQLTPTSATQAEQDAAILYAAGMMADPSEAGGMVSSSPKTLPSGVSALLKMRGDELELVGRTARRQLEETLAVIYPRTIARAA